MNADRYRAALDQLCWSARSVATKLNVSPRACQYWLHHGAPKDVLEWLEKAAQAVEQVGPPPTVKKKG
jgi:hypothetical protein